MYNFSLRENEITEIKSALTAPGGVIGFPTDTVWGIGCDINNELAVKRIYSTKERPQNKPLILLGSKIEYLTPYIKNINETASKIIKKYLPGAVTIVLQKSNLVPDSVTSGFDTVGIRVPDYIPFLELLNKAVDTHVLATTSANISGARTSLSKKEVEDCIGNDIDYILDDYGFESKESESTVVLVNEDGSFKILRHGAVDINI
jgi:L-threonylcarbamoyladenylate synthase